MIEALAVHGRIVSFGTSAGADVQFNMQMLYRKGLSILGYAGGQLGHEERARGLRAGARGAPRRLAARPDRRGAPARQVNEAFERLAERKVQGKLVLDLQR